MAVMNRHFCYSQSKLEAKLAYEILNKATVFEGKVFAVDRVEIMLPDERQRKYDLVTIQNAVTILPLDADNNVLFVRQFRVGSNSQMLELPAGKIETGEEALATAEREIREETGMAAGKMTPLGSFYMSPGYSTEYMWTFLATELYAAPLQPDADEFLNVVKIPLAQVRSMIAQGEITDGKTLAVFMQAFHLFEG
jgi:ADP-ribose pyrophosphatase